jgi:hypothetical protein
MHVTDGEVDPRLGKVEDHLAILQLIARHGLATDSANWLALKQVWAENATYRIPDGRTLEGHEGLRTLLVSDVNQDLGRRGCARVTSIPYVVIDGDKAVATHHDVIMRHLDGRFQVEQIAATRWEFERTNGRWAAKRRHDEVLRDNPAARALLQAGSDLLPDSPL